MPVKTILLHMTDDERDDLRLAVAAGYARRFSAFVEVVYIAMPVNLPAAVGVRGDTYTDIAEATVIAQHKAAQTEKTTRKALKECAYSWAVAEGDHIEVLADQSITADLAIITVPDPEYYAGGHLHHLHDRLPLVAPCPVLILPRDLPADSHIGRHVVIAWKPMREASVAVRNALPLLALAEKVTVITIEAANATSPDPVGDVLLYLQRHGISAHHLLHTYHHGDVGLALLEATKEAGGDLLVMGAYGHSRLRELVLGSATRAVLRHLEIPVLMSH